MIYGIPLFIKRVAPRCTIADSILLVKVSADQIIFKKVLKIDVKSWSDLLKIFNDNNVDTLVCGGINIESRKLSTEQGITIIDNVSCSEKEVVEAIRTKTLKAEFGFSANPDKGFGASGCINTEKKSEFLEKIDCLECEPKKCIEGGTCNLSLKLNPGRVGRKTVQMLNSALDISLEGERILCRVSELIYFAIEMNYKKIGIAYCTDLSEPAGIISNALKCFFDVFPVCCKIGGKQLHRASLTGVNKIECNPAGQADILNSASTDLNVIIGLCIGADCIFTELSEAPVTTLFVKDKSLANNPIGAVYSDYYLKEVVKMPVTKI